MKEKSLATFKIVNNKAVCVGYFKAMLPPLDSFKL